MLHQVGDGTIERVFYVFYERNLEVGNQIRPDVTGSE